MLFSYRVVNKDFLTAAIICLVDQLYLRRCRWNAGSTTCWSDWRN